MEPCANMEMSRPIMKIQTPSCEPVAAAGAMAVRSTRAP